MFWKYEANLQENTHAEMWVWLNRAPTFTQLHLPPLSSTQLLHLHLAHSNLHPAPSISTQLILASIQLSATPMHARNYPISPNLGRKIQNCLFWLKICTYGILDDYESGLRFLKFRHQNPFLCKFVPKK